MGFPNNVCVENILLEDQNSVYEHLVTSAARDQQLVPTTRSQDFLKYSRKPHRLLSAQVFFFNFAYFISKYC